MIRGISVSQVLDSRKKRTVKVVLKTDKGRYIASAASGTSEGKYEAKAIKISAAIKNFRSYKKKFIGENEKDTDNIIEKIGIGNLGAHLSISLSIAAFRAVSKNNVYSFLNSKVKTLPMPLGNVIGGGAHKGYLTEQEFLVFPLKAKTMREAIETNLSIWKEIQEILKSHKIKSSNNYEGAWIFKMNDIRALELLYAVAKNENAAIGIDFAASEYYKDGFYHYKNLNRKLSPEQQLEFVLDPFHQDDFKHFSELTRKADCMIVGDDLFVTNAKRLEEGVEKKAGNSIIIKPDQAGTVTRVLKTVKLAKKSGFSTVVSHRSGETTDDFISDLAVAIGSPLIKCGIYGKVREAKHKRLLEIWKKIKNPRMARLDKSF